MIKRILHGVVWRIERLADRIIGQRDKRRVIEPYMGYATPEHLVVRGRVLTSIRQNAVQAQQSRWENFREMLSLFLTDEVGNVTVTARGVTAQSDEEGYFTLLLPRTDEAGWSDVTLRVEGQEASVTCPVLVASGDAEHAIISDIDDTMLVTGAYRLWRNLWTSLTGNALTRRVYPDAVRFVEQMAQGGRNPVYYVSSSPWNLHGFLRQVFERAHLPLGPMFLRDLGISRSQFITGTHGDHKGGSIDILLAANPGLDHVLVGDTGQHDAFVYRDVIKRHPGRIMGVVLRTPGPGPDAKATAAIAEIEALGVPVLLGTSFDGFSDTLLAGRHGARAGQGLSG